MRSSESSHPIPDRSRRLEIILKRVSGLKDVGHTEGLGTTLKIRRSRGQMLSK